MRTAKSIEELHATLAQWSDEQQTIAFVPTMGNLHAGHVRLMQEARQHATRVVASIFVNPLQFNDANDLARYPRTLDQDMAALAAAGVDLLFTPQADELYPPGDVTRVHVAGLSEILCGAFRPGHFVGMSTVVCKLFNIVQADIALFGLKDFQQFKIIQRMVSDLALPIEVVGIDTVREADGLAMSSRNGHLSADERARAPLLYRELCSVRDTLRAGEKDLRTLEGQAMHALQHNGFKPEYFSVRRAMDLSKAQAGDQDCVILAAAWLGNTRLIDNIVL